MEVPAVLKEMGYAHDSASGATAPKDEMILKLWVRHNNMRLPMAARPWAGICVQQGVDLALGLADYNEMLGQQEPTDMAQAVRSAMSKYDEYKPRDWDGGKDAEEFDAFREHIPEMVAVGIASVKDCFSKANLIEGEYQRWLKVDGLDVPVMLYQDYSAGGMQADLKCSLLLRNPPKKDGTRSWRIPKPRTTPTWQQVMQQAVYWKATGQMPSLLFVTASGYHIANSQNCEALTEDSLNRAFNDAVRSWKTTQNLIRAAYGNWNTLAGLVQPDFNEISRRHGPSITQLARQLWSD
tara:strand:+ start:709 stop:1593 length:885 start_codon:yes stop_codon:yes gene_type:complete